MEYNQHIAAVLGRESRAAQQIEQFMARTFEQGYGEGHILLVCHAAFPVLLTPDLLYKLWLNFQQYSDEQGQAQIIERVAVSDILQSTLVKEVGTDIFEMHPKIRSALIYCLEKRFEGQGRLEELARFMLQYLSKYHWKSDPLLDQTREVQEFNALAYLEPGLAAKRLREAFSQAIQQNVRGDQVRIQTLVDRIEKQYQTLGKELKAGEKAAFEALTSYTTGMQAFAKGEVDTAVANLSNQVLPASTPSSSGKNIATIHVPKSVQQVLEERQAAASPGKIVALIVAIDDYKLGNKLRYCVSDAQAIKDFLERELEIPFEYQFLFNEEAIKRNIQNALYRQLEALQTNDLLLVYLVGTGIQGGARAQFGGKAGFVCFDGAEIQRKTRTPRRRYTGILSDVDFRKILQQANTQDAYITLVFDACNMGTSSWIDLQNPKQVLLAASRLSEETYESPEFEGGLFTQSLINILQRHPIGSITQHSLWNFLEFRVQEAREEQHPQLFGHRKALIRPFLSMSDDFSLSISIAVLWDALDINSDEAKTTFKRKHNIQNDEELLQALEKALLFRNSTNIQVHLPHANEERRVINNLRQILEALRISYTDTNLENLS
ncbi:MAG: caspase family protein [Bacteroidota bacterium]